MKIYSDDPNLPYKTTKLIALYTKSDIDGLFTKWDIKDVYWHPDLQDVYIVFKINEEIDGKRFETSGRVRCPIIWDHKTLIQEYHMKRGWDSPTSCLIENTYWPKNANLLKGRKRLSHLLHIMSQETLTKDWYR